MILVPFQGKTFNIHSNPSVRSNHWCQRSWSWMVLWWPTRTSRIITKKKRCPFYHKGLERKSRKSRDTKNNKQFWPWSRKWSKAKANRILSRKHAGHSKHPFPTTQEATQHMDITITITRWSIPKLDWLCSLQLRMEKLYTVSKNKTWSQLWLRLWATYCKIQA